MAKPDSTITVCTLAEGDYHHGVAALVNSLVASGYVGSIWVGWRGPLPPWTRTELGPDGLVLKAAHCRVVHLPLREGVMPANLKPEIMQEVLLTHAPNSSGVVYFDPDIVVSAPWWFYEKWVSYGVAVCEDNCFSRIAANHYLRKNWSPYIKKVLGVKSHAALDQGFNSGFVGVARSCSEFLSTWRSLQQDLPTVGIELDAFKPGTRFDPFFGTDQDTLDMATMVHSESICALGTEGMGFTNGMTAMWHAVDGPKPWRRFYLGYLLRTGQRISEAQRGYWRQAGGPIQTRSRRALFLRRLDIGIAIALSRFYSSP